LLKVSPFENSDIYYGMAGSYGSLGILVSTEIQLIPVEDFIYLTYHFLKPIEAIEKLKSYSHLSKKPTFLDGIIFSNELAVVIEGNVHSESSPLTLPTFSLKSPSAPWFFQHVKELANQSPSQSCQEKMSLEDYFFRYDLGGFWMGAFLFQLPFLTRFISEGILGFGKADQENFLERDIQRFHHPSDPPYLSRTFLRQVFNAKNLWVLLHKAEQWVQHRMVIQDFCIPETQSIPFCEEILNDPAIFPIWLCPIKGTRNPQIFAPHLLSPSHENSHFINFGIYGIPAKALPISEVTKKLEQMTEAYGGRKVLYSNSYYTKEEFWRIYSRSSYDNLRRMTEANGIWHEITDKVLSS